MEKTKMLKKINIILVILLSLIMTISCGKQSEKPKVSNEKEKIPEGLNSMVEKSDSIIEDIEKIMEEMKKPEKKEEQQQKQGQEEQQGQGGEQSSGGGEESKEGESSSGGGGSEQKEEPVTKEEKIQSMWEDLGKSVKEIHTGWNDYEIIALEMGAKTEDTEKFEDALNSLTVAVEKKDILESLSQTNRMNYYMSVFFDPYKGNPDGELMRLKYFVRQGHLFGLLNDWNKSGESIVLAENSINTLRTKINLEEKDKKLMEKLNLSLINMKSVIERNDVELLKVKRDIVLKNLDDLKEKAK